MMATRQEEPCVEFLNFEREMTTEQDEMFEMFSAARWNSDNTLQIFKKSKPNQYITAGEGDYLDLRDMC